MERGPHPTLADTRAVTVHGRAGALDLMVPTHAAARDIAREYARQAGLSSIPVLFTTLGQALRPEESLGEARLESGSLLVAVDGVRRGGAAPAARAGRGPRVSSAAATDAWLGVAAGLAVLAGWLATRLPQDGRAWDLTVGVLAAAALLGVLPWSGAARQRALAAPAFGGAVVFAVAWSPGTSALPVTLGAAAAASAAVAAVARALSEGKDEGLAVWIAAGGAFFAVAAGAALLGLGPAVVWSVALLLATLGVRIVPALAVDVPDQLLVDLERLAVTAWSARDRPRGRRGRTIVPTALVSSVADRGGRIITAGSVAIAVVAAVSSLELLVTVDAPVDRVGARWLVFLCAAVMLLAARSYRHRAARAWLRLGGLLSWGALAWFSFPGLGEHGGLLLAVGCAVCSTGLVVAGVAAGRGWRSAWWSRRAELAEAIAGSFAVAVVCVSTGLFRQVWEFGSTMFRG